MSHKLWETLLVVLQHVMVEQCLMSIKIPLSSALMLTLQERFPKDRELQLLPILAQRFLILPRNVLSRIYAASFISHFESSSK